ncbi:HEAT repeat domain-containing protein [Neobacillus sp. PS2-9]|uniref:HEAT repeat domain-containing protein n=1 Tax=Neobacillus sp. PS2-9 TaxID=3070676 RepID=UPI0027DEDDB7|nr:HEAT repeat domain-containing protein [Neobacillus sp. PS2-9]WML56484.1 HEAT repeat domain-containing protein [Neobacillus sp. PS2-9]
MGKLNKELLISEIRDLGYSISSIEELKKIDNKNKDVIPIILRHLSQITEVNHKEFLVRCLGVKGFISASIPLINEFKNSSNNTYKWAIGNSLSLILDKSSLNELLKIATDKKHGTARQMIVDGLGKFKDKKVIPVLVGLLEDKDVQGHALSALSKFKDPELIPHINPFVNHEITWIRNTAKRTINKLEKLNKE